jgi:glycerophosphoryl diester phosphodiesterase
MIVIAHRGASAYAPEHTIAAYDLAIEMAADYIEQDLQMSRDGELVVMHDSILDRTTSCSGLVIDRTLEELERCDAGLWFGPEFRDARIPTLRALFARYGHSTSYYIETKEPGAAPGMEEALLRLIREFGLRDAAVEKWQVLIQSFSRDSLLKIHSLDAALPLVQLIEDDQTSAKIRALLPDISSYAIGIGPARTSVDAPLVDAVHDEALVIHPYTVNVPADMKRMIALGVDGMFTDCPDRLRALLLQERS